MRYLNHCKAGSFVLGLALSLATHAMAQSPSESLSKYEQKLQATTTQPARLYLLNKLAPIALAANDPQKAGLYANELLREASTQKDDRDYGNAIHIGNLILGQIALSSGNIAEAKQYLLAAGNTPGSPQLNSFGPNMLLAQQLIEKGERDTVLEYFQLCAKFWKDRNGDLDDWTALVKGGRMPKFGPSLVYGLR